MPTTSELLKMAERLDNRVWLSTDHTFPKGVNDAPLEAAVMLRAVAAEREWRTMESAPKDGTQFLAKDGDSRGVISWEADQEAWQDHGFQLRIEQPEPTHWRPLPTPETSK